MDIERSGSLPTIVAEHIEYIIRWRELTGIFPHMTEEGLREVLEEENLASLQLRRDEAYRKKCELGY